MTSESETPREAYVWIWLAGAAEPVVAGRIEADGDNYSFNYGRSYLERENAVPIYLPELPLQRGAIAPSAPLKLAGCLRDGAPDAWGRRVIINRLTGMKGALAREIEFDELTYMLQSGSDRVGNLDFQASAMRYEPRETKNATLEELQSSAERVVAGEPLNREIDRALFHGGSIGGARPKALIEDGDTKYVAKFSSSGDTYSVVKAEYIAMRLAALAGLNAAPVKLTRASHKDVLLVERFDREKSKGKWMRRGMVSALTIFGLDELMARHASYEDLAETVRARFTDPRQTLRELFARMTFNILVGNSDDHARNHAAFWDGEYLTLTPAYDICPQARAGREATQAMLIHGDGRRSQLSECLRGANAFLVDEAEALGIMRGQIACIRENWDEVSADAKLTATDKALLWGRQFLNPFALEALEDRLA